MLWLTTAMDGAKRHITHLPLKSLKKMVLTLHISCQVVSELWDNWLMFHRQALTCCTNSNLSVFFQPRATFANLFICLDWILGLYCLWQHHLPGKTGWVKKLPAVSKTHQRATVSGSNFNLTDCTDCCQDSSEGRNMLRTRAATAGEENKAPFFNMKIAASI